MLTIFAHKSCLGYKTHIIQSEEHISSPLQNLHSLLFVFTHNPVIYSASSAQKTCRWAQAPETAKRTYRASPFGIRIIRTRRNRVSVSNIQHGMSDKTVTESRIREKRACRNCIWPRCILPHGPQKIGAGQETQNTKRRWKTKWLLPTATIWSTPMPARR